MKTISKSETAKRFGVAPSMVSKYIAKGMPVTATGKVNWRVAQEWRRKFIVPERSGSYGARHRKPEVVQAYSPDLDLESMSLDVQEPAPSVYYKILLDKILSKRNLLPAILADLGIKDRVLLYAVDDIFAALVLGFAGDLAPYDWEIEDIPLTETDVAGVFSKFGLGEVTQQIIDKSDEMAFAAFEKAEEI